jgi:hypothetical protein
MGLVSLCSGRILEEWRVEIANDTMDPLRTPEHRVRQWKGSIKNPREGAEGAHHLDEAVVGMHRQVEVEGGVRRSADLMCF